MGKVFQVETRNTGVLWGLTGGLLIAVPGYFMAYAIKRRKDEYEAFLVRLESLTLQQFKRKAMAS